MEGMLVGTVVGRLVGLVVEEDGCVRIVVVDPGIHTDEDGAFSSAFGVGKKHNNSRAAVNSRPPAAINIRLVIKYFLLAWNIL